MPESTKQIEDIPKIGSVMWLLLLAMMIPAGALVWIGNSYGGFENQKIFVIILSLPMPLVLFSLPRKYILDGDQLKIIGFFYRIVVDKKDIAEIAPVSAWQAVLSLNAIYCSDPTKAIKITKRVGRNLIISPQQSDPFIKWKNH
jgi:hypothetical protein